MDKYWRPLTQKQQEIFEFIASFRQKHGFAPTYRNIGNHFGFTEHCAYGQVQALEKKGYIVITRGVARGIIIKGEEHNGGGSVQRGSEPREGGQGANKTADTRSQGA